MRLEYTFLMRPRHKPVVSESIQRSAATGRTGRSSLHPTADIHKKDWISIDIDVLSDALDFSGRSTAAFDGPIHALQFRNNRFLPVSEQLRGILCFFSGDIRNLPD